MGIFGDIFREVVSEIGNVVIEEISKEFNQNNYDEQRVQELKVSMDNYSLEEVRECTKSTDNDMKEAAIRTLDFRTQFIEDIRENGENSDFGALINEYDDEDFIKIYMNFMEKAEKLYGENADVLIKFLRHMMLMKGSVSRYAEIVSGYYADTDYLDLMRITKQVVKTVDTVLLEEAYREKWNREELVRIATSDEIKELEDVELMDLTNLARCDSLVYHDDGTYHYSYFGYDRDKVLHNCEKEISRCRKHLLKTFIEEYCDEEFRRYYSYSKERLQAIADWKEGQECEYENGYDYFDRLIAALMIEIKIKEEE